MSELDDVRAYVPALRQQVKSWQRVIRGASQILADFEERLAALEDAQPLGGKANGRNKHSSRDEEIRLVKH